ncbi:hypothetical protein EDB85DRAFT_1889777 [Lactarius pseudohatsudake]|nr:hypothetical protein EDB85DRAFT_1889777 [Lactarius pseudohatsudake]
MSLSPLPVTPETNDDVHTKAVAPVKTPHFPRIEGEWERRCSKGSQSPDVSEPWTTSARRLGPTTSWLRRAEISGTLVKVVSPTTFEHRMLVVRCLGTAHMGSPAVVDNNGVQATHLPTLGSYPTTSGRKLSTDTCINLPWAIVRPEAPVSAPPAKSPPQSPSTVESRSLQLGPHVLRIKAHPFKNHFGLLTLLPHLLVQCTLLSS